MVDAQISNIPHSLWRGGGLLPLGCEADPNLPSRSFSRTAITGFATAAQPSGSKLPRHRLVPA
ncbi:hypothetical protein C1X52_11880 [Pseudomonas sp. FW306-2-1A-C05A]|nr:hypothetical protein C1X52_11880 [Pseudomonas sp. FW306-2-1A-C05A]